MPLNGIIAAPAEIFQQEIATIPEFPGPLPAAAKCVAQVVNIITVAGCARDAVNDFSGFNGEYSLAQDGKYYKTGDASYCLYRDNLRFGDLRIYDSFALAKTGKLIFKQRATHGLDSTGGEWEIESESNTPEQVADPEVSLIPGVKYRIITYASGDDFTNVGAASNADAVEFIALGEDAAEWSHGSVLEIMETAAPTVTSETGLYDQIFTVTKEQVQEGLDVGQVINALAADGNGSQLVFNASPTNSADYGVLGNIATDGTYFYVCIAANTWKRVLISSIFSTW